jgi:hypothetical protein
MNNSLSIISTFSYFVSAKVIQGQFLYFNNREKYSLEKTLKI